MSVLCPQNCLKTTWQHVGNISAQHVGNMFLMILMFMSLKYYGVLV